MSLTHILQLIVLAALWGSSFLFMRVGVTELSPLMVTLGRVAIATLFLCTLLLIKGQFRHVVQRWFPLVIVGLTNTAIPFCLFAYATIYVEAGYAAILNATAPMFTAITAFVWLKVKLPRLGLLGLVVGFTGVLFLVLSKLGDASQTPLLPILGGLLAALQYGIAANITKIYLSKVPSLSIAGGSSFFATLMLIPFAYFQMPQQEISHVAWLSVGALGVACTAIPYILYFNLLNQIGVNKTISVTYLIPVFAVVWGMIFLHEPVTWSMLLGALLVLFGVSLTTGMVKFGAKAPSPHIERKGTSK
jgi:drug/metabolite transporter (DMT)-like permease